MIITRVPIRRFMLAPCLPSDGFFIDIGVPASFDEAQATTPAW
jgi:hypothetical protein